MHKSNVNLLDFCKTFRLAIFIFLIIPVNSYSADSEVVKGRRIYMEGQLPSGGVLKGVRNGVEFTGKEAACVACHRPSGMGSVEGDIEVPPITGNYLYRTGDLMLATMDPRGGKRFNQAHEPYTDKTLATAIRKGENVSGQQMTPLMPHYDFKDDELRALIAYLKQLSQHHSPGVTADEIHFATVITPDADKARSDMLVRMLKRGFAQKNGSTVSGSKRTGRRHMVTAAEMVLGTERNWVLHIWELKGSPETWKKQLEDYYHSEPVFAILSGISGSSWQPVSEFCEEQKIPSWFPSVDIPVTSGDGFYTLYFHDGVKLEASVLAKYINDDQQITPDRIVQIYRDDALGRGAALALTNVFKNSNIKIENHFFNPTDLSALKSLLAGLGSKDAAMLWLKSTDLSLLSSIDVPSSNVFVSGRMSGEKIALPPNWKQVAKIIYPYELPEKRQVSLNYFHRWMRFNMIPIEDEPLQAETYFALEFLTETIAEMLDNLYRDYLIERVESMLSRSQSSNSEVRDRTRQVMRWSTRTPRGTPQQAAKIEQSAAGAEKHIPGANYAEAPSKSTTIYPRMSLGVSQRFASKGAYIVRFDDKEKYKIQPLTTWIVP